MPDDSGLSSINDVMLIIYSAFAHRLLKNESGIYQLLLNEQILSVWAFFWLFIHQGGLINVNFVTGSDD